MPPVAALCAGGSLTAYLTVTSVAAHRWRQLPARASGHAARGDGSGDLCLQRSADIAAPRVSQRPNRPRLSGRVLSCGQQSGHGHQAQPPPGQAVQNPGQSGHGAAPSRAGADPERPPPGGSWQRAEPPASRCGAGPAMADDFCRQPRWGRDAGQLWLTLSALAPWAVTAGSSCSRPSPGRHSLSTVHILAVTSLVTSRHERRADLREPGIWILTSCVSRKRLP